MKSQHSFQVGDRVLISRKGIPFNSLIQTEESGIVLATNVVYERSSSSSDADSSNQEEEEQQEQQQNDGILVKLQISNTRQVFSPDHVFPCPAVSSPPTTRNQRRVRVTPSPSTVAVEPLTTTTIITTTVESSTIDSDSNKRKRKEEDDIITTTTSSSNIKKKTKTSKADDDDIPMEDKTSFRVETARSSTGKCLLCYEIIRKDTLRIQPTTTSRGKKGWYHVECVRKCFPGVVSWHGPNMEGYADLSEGERRLLETFLNDGKGTSSSSIDVVPSINDVVPSIPRAVPSMTMIQEEQKEKEGEGESDDDPPLASMMTKKKKKPFTNNKNDMDTSKVIPIQEGTKRGKNIKNKQGRKEKEVDEDIDDGILRASDTDSDDLKDMPYRVEYATSGRATCKGCDEVISKGHLRIAEKALFNGKPGFTVYRHLHCTIFGEEISRLQDVGGWRRLKTADRQLVQDRIEESSILIEKENQELQPDELVQVGFQGEIRDSPKGLAANLLPFQVEGTSWMVHQELHVPSIRGGILADEMGMGKTLQTITTILDNRPKLQWSMPGAKHPPAATDVEERNREEALWKESLETWKIEMEKSNVPKHLISPKPGKKKGPPVGARAGTLVICPVIALYQWREEIKKFTDENTLSVCCYHGPNRQSEFPREMLTKYDIVLTTYQVIEADFRKMISPNKVKCPNCGGNFRVDKLKVHLKYFCGENAQRTEAQARQRRTTDRPAGRGGGNPNPNRPGGPNSGSKKKSSKVDLKSKVMKKDPMKKPDTKKAAQKKVIRTKHTKGFESDSSLSVEEDYDVTSPRSRRSAAVSASKKMTATAKKWGVNSDSDSDADDSEAFSSNDDSGAESSDDDDDDEVPTTKRINARKTATKAPSDDDSSDDDSDADETVARAKEKQNCALARVKDQKKKVMGKDIKKSFGNEKKGTSKLAKKAPAGKKAKKTPLPSGFSSDDDDGSSNEDRDPMDGIDMDKLMEDAMKGSRESVLHMMCWWRVVLDEAHVIKSRSSQTAAAAFSLTSIHRWCLSGTPLQNRVGELYSLIRFLRIDPMAYYFCRKVGSDCKSLHYRMLNGKCLDCGNATIQHYSYFNKHVLNPIQRAGYQGDGRRAMMKLKDEVLDKALIRRTKQSRAEDMNLPPRVVTIRAVRLHPIEEDFYNALYTQTKSSFDDYVNEGTLLNNYAHIFDLLTKMRQAVDHPYLIVYSKKNAGTIMANSSSRAVANGTVECQICQETPTDRVVSSCCGSGFCRNCVIEYMTPALESLEVGTRCPCCRAPFSVDLNQETSDVVDESILTVTQGTGSATAGMPSLKEMPHVSSSSILRRINLAEFATSTKIEALVQELVQMRQQRPGSKALVFSQFVNMLDLIRWRLHSDPCLHDLGLGVRIIHGGMSVTSRDEALKEFRTDSSVRVLLMSLKAGGVALNLTVANEAYLMDPWWNPAAEMQAIDRTHRLGQYRPIRAVRFIADGTVEERVLQLQEKKRLVFDGTVGRDAASLKMLTVEDMKAMFT